MTMVLIVIVQTLIAIGLGAFFALERRTAGDPQDCRALGLVGGLSALAGFMIASTTAPPVFDYMVVMGAISFAAAMIGRELVEDLAVLLNRGAPAKVDFMSLGCTMWAGAACGIGDVRGCILVILVMACAAVSRPKTVEVDPVRLDAAQSDITAETTDQMAQFAISSRAPTLAEVLTRPLLSPAQAAQDPMMVSAQDPNQLQSRREFEAMQDLNGCAAENCAEENAVHEAAQELSLLAQALRMAQAANAKTAFEDVAARMMPVARPAQQPVYARRTEYLPHHNVAIRHHSRQRAGQDLPVSRVRLLLQRCNHAAL